MRKAVTILLLAAFLLNVLGFYGLFLGLKAHNEIEQISAIESGQQDMSDALTFAVPLVVPYYTDTHTDYQRVDGEFEHDGEMYRMIKQKLQRDTLYVVCIKDNKSKQLTHAIEGFVKTFTDKPADAKKDTKTTNVFSKDYLSSILALEPAQTAWQEAISFTEHPAMSTIPSAADVFSPPRI